MFTMLANTLVPVFFVMLLGYFAGWRGIVHNGNVETLNAVLMNFALPASLFLALATMNRSELPEHGVFALLVTVLLLVVYAAVYLLKRQVFGIRRGDGADETLTVAFPNFASIGLPLASSVFGPALGQEAALVVSLCIAVGAVTVSPLTLALMADSTAERGSGTSTGRRFLHALAGSVRKPIVLAPVFGLIVSLIGLPMPKWALLSFTEIGSVTAGLALFITGVILSAQPIRLNTNVALGMLVKNVLQPLLAFGLVRLLGVEASEGNLLVLLTAIPCGFFGIVFGLGFQIWPRDAGSTVVLSSAFGVVSLAVAIGLLAPA